MLDVPKRPIGRPPGGALAAGQNTSDILIDAAVELFARQNYWAVSVKDIALRAGMNASLIYYYFGSKDELFLAVIETMVSRAFSSFEALQEGRGRQPDEIIRLWVEMHARNFPLLRKLLLISIDYARTATRAPRVDRAIQRFYDREERVLTDAITSGIDSGLFRRVNVTTFVGITSTFLDGALVRSVTLVGYDAPAAMKELADYLISRLVHDT